MVSVPSEASITESLLEEAESDVNVKDIQEESSKGKVRGSLFMKYLLAGGNVCFVVMVLILYVLTQVAASSVDFFVSYWVTVEAVRTERLVSNSTEIAGSWEPTTETCLYIYGGLILALFIIALCRSMTFYKLAMVSSQNLHDSMFTSVINTNMRFFDTNPGGRILNRFSKDIGCIDELLPKSILDAGQILLLMAGSLILVAIVKPYFLVPIALIAVVFMLLRIIFLKSSKNIKRLEGMSKFWFFVSRID